MAKKLLGLGEIIVDMFTTHSGSISSKIVVGAVTYFIITLALVIMMFVDPSFPGLSDLLSLLIITSSSLLGLTTFENIKQIKQNGKAEN